MTKPGYGIVSECVANGAAIVYTSRGRFAEYPVMVAEMPPFLRCTEIAYDDLLAGRWLAALERVGALPPPDRPRNQRRRGHCGYDRRGAPSRVRLIARQADAP